MELRFWTVIYFCTISYINAFSNPTGKEFELVRDMLSSTRYNPKLKPRSNATDIIEVHVSLNVSQLYQVIEIESKVNVFADIQLQWTDEYLAWDPHDYDGITVIEVRGEDIWIPALSVYNKIGANFLDDFSDVIATVTSGGGVKILSSGQIAFKCIMSPAYFPFDCHLCEVRFGVKNEDERKIKFNLKSVEKKVDVGTPIWDMMTINTFIDLGIPPLCNVKLLLNRQSYYYLMTIVLPSSLLAVLNIVTLFIPSEEGERIGCGMTIFLSFIVFLTQVLDIIPRTSHTTPAIEVYFFMLMVSSILATIDSVYASRIPPTRKEDEMMAKKSEIAVKRPLKNRIGNYMTNLPRFRVFCVMSSITFTIAAYAVLFLAYRDASCLLTV